MQDCFEKYKQAKLTLLYLIKENYRKSYLLENAIKSNLTYEECDIYNINFINIYFHDYDPLAILSWNYLEIEKSLFTDYEARIIENKIINESQLMEIDYYKKYLKIYLLINRYIVSYYTYEMAEKRAFEMGISYRKNDIENDKVVFCDHYDMEAGKKAWNFLEIEKDIIPKSAIENMSNNVKIKLIELDNIKVD